MPNRGQGQDQNQRGQKDQGMRNPGAFSPDDDEAQEADQTHLGADQRREKKRRNPADPNQQTEIEDPSEDEEVPADEDDDEEDGSGARM